MGLFDHLPTLNGQPAEAVPKPRARVLDRIAYKAERDRQDRAFRQAVWTRDGGQCRLCGRKVARSVSSDVRGHVHHIRGRNVAPEDRFNPKAALLLCAICHAKVHAGELKVTR